MKYSTIRIEGSILSADILDKISQEELSGQNSIDFGLSANSKVKDEIVRAWADAQDMWRVYKRRTLRLKESDYGTSETRKFWVAPLLEMLGFDAGIAKSEIVNGKSYAISHRVQNLDNFPVHIMGFRDSLDKKRTSGGPRMSPHGLVQEYLNLTEHLYAIVANGTYLRLLRDSSRLIKLSFIEFDLASMMDDEHFADFAIMYRLLHVSRMPQKMALGAESLIEQYHQDALDSGSRIRNGLSHAVESSICMLGDGFLAHPDNEQFRNLIADNKLNADKLYEFLLKLIYRLLFLMVIEERNLVYPKGCNKEKRKIYYDYYSVASLRRISEKPYLADQRFSNLWINLKNCFALFDSGTKGEKLDLKPLAGDLFGYNAIGELNRCSLDNKTLLTCLRNLNIFENPVTKQQMRVNYGSLNVEEFGSVYEGLLEKDPVLQQEQGKYSFAFRAGGERSSSGSHYTPDELVQPLIKHSLDYIISDRRKHSDPIAALLSIKVCDVACGSGHILLNAARRIGGEVAKLRSGEEQPSPEPFRQGVRDAISHCIYGVDKNPLAVELCKVALWLEAHDPGKPLSFLDHHIKCGDAIVGLAHKEELESGIANEAFKKLAGDDKDVVKRLRDKNKQQIKKELIDSQYIELLDKPMTELAGQCRQLNQIDQKTPDDVENARTAYQGLVSGEEWWRLKSLADIQVSQFFIPKTEENEILCITHGEYKDFLEGRKSIQSRDVAKAIAVSEEKLFFHWFLEFPEIFERGGFDCILGNPPFLGGQKLSGTFGANFLNYVKTTYAPIKSVDIVTYFFRRIFSIIKPGGFQALLSTNTISQGNAREGGLAVIAGSGGSINFAIPSMRWPGQAAVEVSVVAVFKGQWKKDFFLHNKVVPQITSYLDDSLDLGDPHPLKQNMGKSFQGTIVLGQGFVLQPEEAVRLIAKDPKNKDVLFPYLNGQDLNGQFDQSPRRWVINFFDWSEEYCRENYPDSFKIVEKLVKPQREENKYSKTAKELWWQYERSRPELYETIRSFENILVTAQVSKTVAFSFVENNKVFDAKLIVFALEEHHFFTVLQSSFHYNWAWKYCTTMKADLSYTPGTIFQTFPFPQNIGSETEASLAVIGRQYHEFRSQLMHQLQLGLTKTYNLFHMQELTTAIVEKASKQDVVTATQSHQEILQLRELHKEMDKAVLAAYGWTDVDLAHNFYDMDYLPENDRTRYTISPESRKEILKRLLQLNHDIYAEEETAGLHGKKKISTKKTKISKKIETAMKKGQSVPGNIFDSGRKIQ